MTAPELIPQQLARTIRSGQDSNDHSNCAVATLVRTAQFLTATSARTSTKYRDIDRHAGADQHGEAARGRRPRAGRCRQ